MQNTVKIDLDVASFLTENGIEIYVSSDAYDPVILKLTEEVEEFLDNICDVDGKSFVETVDELQRVTDTFEICLKKLKDAKR